MSIFRKRPFGDRTIGELTFAYGIPLAALCIIGGLLILIIKVIT